MGGQLFAPVDNLCEPGDREQAMGAGKMARVAIVNVGTRGIGAATRKAPSETGYSGAVNCAGDDEATAKSTSETGIPADTWSVADHTACVDGVTWVEAELGPLDALVSNAVIDTNRTRFVT